MAGKITVHLRTLKSIKIKYFTLEGARKANDFLCRSILAVLLTHNFYTKKYFIKQTTFMVKIVFFFLSFYLIWGGTRSLRMPALSLGSQAGQMRNLREGTSIVLRDTIRLT